MDVAEKRMGVMKARKRGHRDVLMAAKEGQEVVTRIAVKTAVWIQRRVWGATEEDGRTEEEEWPQKTIIRM